MRRKRRAGYKRGVRLVLAALLCLSAIIPAHAQDVGALLRAQRWPEAEAAATRLADPLALRLVDFYRALTPRAATLAAIDAFRAANPDWPLQATLTRRREEALAAEADDALAAAACQAEPPAAGGALARCAAAFDAQGDGAAATAAARAAWAAGPSDPQWELSFLRRWGAALEPQDTARRFDRLAWSDTAGAQRLLPLLAPADRAAGAARLALRRDDPKAPNLLAALPPDQGDHPGLVYEHVRWLLHAKRDDDARDLLVSAGRSAEQAADAEHRALFWPLRDLVARRRLRAGDAAGAYDVVADTGQTAPETVGDAAFLAGWIALRQLGRPQDALPQFRRLGAVSSAAISQARAHYWLARAHFALAQPEDARRQAALASAYPFTYYGQLAALAAGDSPPAIAARIAAARDPAWTPAQAAELVSQDLARAAVLLTAWGEPGRGAAFLVQLANLAHDPDQVALIGRLADGIGLPATAVALARHAGRFGTVLPDTGWPLAAAKPDPTSDVDPALVLAVIRQESSFDPGEISPVGARGLMQLMPGTATAEARLLGLQVGLDDLTADPATNIRLGTHYLSGLLARFDASVPLAVAAYNGGPKRVGQWLADNGDPRQGTPDMVDWIELIPFAETRNYVQRVTESAVVFRARLGLPLTSLPVTWTPSPA